MSAACSTHVLGFKLKCAGDPLLATAAVLLLLLLLVVVLSSAHAAVGVLP